VLVECSALTSPQDFEDCVSELMEVSKVYPGGAPRKLVTEGGVFTTTEYEPNLPIPAHCELGYLPAARPQLIAFFCEQAPPAGGMTPVLDMAEILEALPNELVARFAGGIQTSQNLAPDEEKIFDFLRLRFAPPKMTWKSLGSTQAKAAEEWRKRNADRASICWEGAWMQPFVDMPAVLQLGDMQVWSGFFPSFHWTGPAIQTVFDLLLHNRSWRQLRCSALMILGTVWKAVAAMAAHIPILRRLPWVLQSANPGILSCRLKAGGRVSAWDIARILWVYNTRMIKWKWQPGQFVLLDNARMGHARTPFDPAVRLVYTAFGTRKRL